MLPSDKESKIIKSAINECYKAKIFCNRKIIIFGCTLYANEIISEIRKFDIEIYGFIDNDSKKVGGLCSGIRVYSPKELKKINQTEIIVIVASPTYAREMEGQLREYGLADDNIVNIPLDTNNNIHELSEEKFKSQLESVKNGIELYEKIQNSSKNKLIFLFPYPGTGDIYMACGYLNEYIRREQVAEYILVVSKENCKRVAELFGFSQIEVISDKSLKEILLAWQFVGTEKMKVKPLLFWGWNTKYYYRSYRNHEEMSFADYFKYDVFGLGENIAFSHPKRQISTEYPKKLFEDKGWKKGRVIILAPYASSFKSAITLNDWTKITEYLNSKGYTVCTNCYGEEIPIPGTSVIQFPYEHAVSVLEYAGGFIGVRSGLCDVISNSNCKLTIVYESNYLASDYEYFSLRKMGLNKIVNELEFETGEKLLDEIKGIY